MMNHPLDDLLNGLIDYAGLFPPAALDMATAAHKYAEHRKSEYSWALGRFVVPIARLDEFKKAKGGIRENSTEVWVLSALSGTDLSSDLNRIFEFNVNRAGAELIDAIEIKVERRAEIESVMNLMPVDLTPYFEVPIKSDPIEFIKTLAETGARAKVRTGGVTADAFPLSSNLARFIKICADTGVPFKATAGLHHPLRSINRMTYDSDSASTMMHDFLNLFLAAAFAQNGMEIERLIDLLEEKSPEAFRFDGRSVAWHEEKIMNEQLRNTRKLFANSFGSCSFEEPIEDLKKIGLL